MSAVGGLQVDGEDVNCGDDVVVVVVAVVPVLSLGTTSRHVTVIVALQ